ncbi:hypothetical protein [Leptolyngbya sp. AN10]|uniref:hypothetical protein n=1 Tax=Leptolyngbya sp. AN10 TaxID=3423365 RepID=UPI003D32323B
MHSASVNQRSSTHAHSSRHLPEGRCEAPAALAESNAEVDFFRPRQDLWTEHFEADLQTGKIRGITPTGRVTVVALEMNSAAQVAARQLWIRFGLFP